MTRPSRAFSSGKLYHFPPKAALKIFKARNTHPIVIVWRRIALGENVWAGALHELGEAKAAMVVLPVFGGLLVLLALQGNAGQVFLLVDQPPIRIVRAYMWQFEARAFGSSSNRKRNLCSATCASALKTSHSLFDTMSMGFLRRALAIIAVTAFTQCYSTGAARPDNGPQTADQAIGAPVQITSCGRRSPSAAASDPGIDVVLHNISTRVVVTVTVQYIVNGEPRDESSFDATLAPGTSSSGSSSSSIAAADDSFACEITYVRFDDGTAWYGRTAPFAVPGTGQQHTSAGQRSCDDASIYVNAGTKGVELALNTPLNAPHLQQQLDYLNNALQELQKSNPIDQCLELHYRIFALTGIMQLQLARQTPLLIPGLRDSACRQYANLNAQATLADSYRNLTERDYSGSADDETVASLRKTWADVARATASDLGAKLPSAQLAESYYVQKAQDRENARVAITSSCQGLLSADMPHGLFVLIYADLSSK